MQTSANEKKNNILGGRFLMVPNDVVKKVYKERK